MWKKQLSAPSVTHSDSVLLCFVIEDVQFSSLSGICACLCCLVKFLCTQIFTKGDRRRWLWRENVDSRVLRLRTLAEEGFTLQNVNAQSSVLDIKSVDTLQSTITLSSPELQTKCLFMIRGKCHMKTQKPLLGKWKIKWFCVYECVHMRPL